MTRKDLESVHCLTKELKMWQNRLQELQYDIALSPKVLDGMPFQNTNETSSPTEKKAIEMADLCSIIEGRIKEIQYKRYEIDRFAMNIDDVVIRQIIEMRCSMCKTWEEIGDALHMDRTTAYRKYDTFMMDKFPEEL